MKLVLPNQQYKESFLEAWKELNDDPNTSYTFASKGDTIEEVRTDFDAFLFREQERIHGRMLPAEFVPQTHFWLINNEEFIGEVSMRHSLNDHLRKYGGHIGYGIRPSKRNMGYGKEILRLALIEAEKIGITKALITCDEDNIGSRKIIEANGGVLEDIVPNPGHPNKMRWWIDTSVSSRRK